MTTMASDIHVAQTEYFINENPSTVRCLRRTRVATGTGGFTWSAAVDSGERTIRIVGQGSRVSEQPRVSASGEMVVPDGVAISVPDADWLKGDQFMHEGRLYEVVAVGMLPPWRKRLETICHAE